MRGREQGGRGKGRRDNEVYGYILHKGTHY